MKLYSYEKEYREAIYAMNEAANEREEKKEKDELDKMEKDQAERDAIKEAVRTKLNSAGSYHQAVLKEMLSTAFKGIYIGALNEIDLLDPQATKFCEARVDQFIEERGGASALLSEMSSKTYLLSRIATIVEDATEKAEEEADDVDKATEKVPEDAKEDMFDELEKEEDADAAIAVIADRITSAEEEFIKKNADDKKKIEDIVNDINDRIDAVKHNNDMTEEEQDTAEEELEKESSRLISDVYSDGKPKPLFEFMVRKNCDIIVKDPELKNLFKNEAGKLNMDRIVDTTSYMYGFLEFVNTLGLVKIDEEYIREMVNEM